MPIYTSEAEIVLGVLRRKGVKRTQTQKGGDLGFLRFLRSTTKPWNARNPMLFGQCHGIVVKCRGLIANQGYPWVSDLLILALTPDLHAANMADDQL